MAVTEHTSEKITQVPKGERQHDSKYSGVQIEETKIGVWTMKMATELGFNPKNYWKSLKGNLPLLRRLASDSMNISPWLFSLYILCQVWRGIEDTIALQISNYLLKTIEIGISSGSPNTNQIATAVVSQVFFTQFIAYAAWYGEKIEDELETRVTRHFELILLKAKLEVDIPTSKAASSHHDVDASQAWRSLEQIISFYRTLLETASMLLLIIHISRSTGGPMFAFLCASQPFCSALMTREIWDQPSFGYVHDPRYKRMKALDMLASEDKYRQDVISGGIAKWIGNQFRKANDELGTISDMHPFHKFHRIGQQAATQMLIKFLGDLPMMFCAVNAVVNPRRFSVSSIAILQQSASSLKYAFTFALQSGRQFRESNATVKNIYNATVVKNVMIGGDTPYPRPAVAEKPLTCVDPSKGMAFQLRDITFSYIGSKKQTPALNSVSLTIEPGQLVVVVGANGSGKSTLIRILSRLYDPSSGEMLIDGLPCSEYRINDLHQATALLSQENHIYPLTLGENIALGNPECAEDIDTINAAAKMGGSFEFIQKLDNGMETTLEPYLNMWSRNLHGKSDHPLCKEMEEIEKVIDISGGERQRVVASRSFMRFKSGKVNFVAVDEPSSALDAEGELKLFENLLAVREGKTMVFVTHRFGHLTDHADLIICMKDGSVVETGTHTELMHKKGDYAELYTIQARAFQVPSS